MRDSTPEDLVTEVATKLVQELADQLVKAAILEANTRIQLAEPHKPVTQQRIGEAYSVFNWKRVDTGIYETRTANGTRLSVFKSDRASWFAQVGETVLNNKQPVSTKVEAIELVENTLINA